MKKTKLIIWLAVFILSASTNLQAQTSLGGIINQYTKVDSVYTLKDTLGVADASLFQPGDTVLIIQMKGVEIRIDVPSEPEDFGDVDAGKINNAGKYEFILVENVNYAEDLVILQNQLDRDYDAVDFVQLVKVPGPKHAVVSSTITCPVWDGNKGGVIAMIVQDTLELSATINANARGYNGAPPVLNTLLECASSDSALYENFYFDNTFVGAGNKGEAPIETDPSWTRGRGKLLSSGGGGNALFAGGGGGGSGGRGGAGGGEQEGCETPNYGGNYTKLGGKEGKSYVSGLGINLQDSLVFFGGAGGSGTYSASGSATAGGNGGGIVIIVTNILKSNTAQIISKGGSVTNIADDGAGGGGAGGTIILDYEEIQGNLTIDASGGNGGNTGGDFRSGAGGGGGGGYFINAKSSIPSSVNVIFAGGNGGTVETGDPVGYAGLGGAPGDYLNNVGAPLTGFLFNSIVESQEICYGDTPELISGTTPRGGNGIYAYTWQQRTNSTTWQLATGTNDQKHYQPPALTDTTYFRRIVESSIYADTSKSITINVQPAIVNNVILDDDSVCYANAADTIFGTRVLVGGLGEGTYTYTWQSSVDQSTWSNETALADTAHYPGELFETSYFRRTVNSGACYDTSNVLETTVFPLITDNDITIPVDTIADGQQPQTITGLAVGDGYGAGTYDYQWQVSTNGVDFIDIPGEINLDYSPPVLNATTYYRRVVYSNDCESFSNFIKVTVLPLIANNSIENDAVVYTCYNSPPEVFRGSSPTGGDGIYRYTWESSLDATSWEVITGANEQNYQAGRLTEATYYRRIVASGENDCCLDTTDYIQVLLNPLPEFTFYPYDTTICSADTISFEIDAAAGTPPYNFEYALNSEKYTMTNLEVGGHLEKVIPKTSLQEVDHKLLPVRLIDSNGCVDTTDTGEINVKVYGYPNANAGIDKETCELFINLDATPSFGAGLWTLVEGEAAEFADNTFAGTEVDVASAGVYNFQWKETNWQCADSSLVEILLYETPSNVSAGNDTTLFFTDEFELNGNFDNPDEEVPVEVLWEVAEGVATIDDPHNINSSITNLYAAFGEEVKVNFTVEKGTCANLNDTLVITMKTFSPPNGFSPNGDGVNDFLVIKGIDNSIGNELVIYNRWGVEVYRKQDYSNEEGWDGKNNDGVELPEDTYYYVIKVIDKENNIIRDKGFIVLKR